MPLMPKLGRQIQAISVSPDPAFTTEPKSQDSQLYLVRSCLKTNIRWTELKISDNLLCPAYASPPPPPHTLTHGWVEKKTLSFYRISVFAEEI